MLKRDRSNLIVALLAACLCGPASAADCAEPRINADVAFPSAGSLVCGLVSERDASLFFDALRDGLAGRDGSASRGDLSRRLDELARELRARGVRFGTALLDALERRAKEAIRSVEPGVVPRDSQPAPSPDSP